MRMLSPTPSRIIGGMFGFDEIPIPFGPTPPFLSDNTVLLANARSGIALLTEHLAPANVWMPSYFCGHVLKIIAARAAALRFYEVNYDLALTSWTWIDNVQQNDLVVVADYFGFPCDSQFFGRVRERGAWVLEDACQALLTEGVGRQADFVLFSPRKFLGVADGGILSINRGVAPETLRLEQPPAEWWLKAFSALVLRREFDLHGGERRWFELFRETDSEGPVGPYAMSEITRLLLQHGFDYTMIAQQRIDNYRTLLGSLKDVALFPTLPAGVVPLGFPIRVQNRDHVRQALFNQEMYPPVHWPIKGVIPETFTDSHRLETVIMTLPCDQRYGSDDMERMIDVVLKEILP